jgi:ribosome recycling factor
MTEEIDFILESTEESMNGSIAHLEKSFLNIRAGKASPQMLGSVFVAGSQYQHTRCPYLDHSALRKKHAESD